MTSATSSRARSGAARAPRQPPDPAVTVALHRLDDRWVAVAIRREAASCRLVEARDFPVADSSSVAAWIEGRRPAQVVAVLPASSVICRSVSLPAGPAERLMPALALQAEAHLADAVPPHRRAMAVLPVHAGESGATGVIVGWPESAAAPAMPELGPLGLQIGWTPEIVALSELVAGAAIDEPALWISRDESSVALVLPTPAGPVLRATREDAGSDEEWRSDVRRVVGETALAARLPAPVVRDLVSALDARMGASPTTALLLPETARARVVARLGGAPTDPEWWNRHGLAAGAAMAAGGELAAAASLQESPPRANPSPLALASDRLSRRRTALLLAALAVVVVALGPLAFARVRLGLLRYKVPDLRELQRENTADARRRAMYAEMRRETWSISKLLADLANATPEGIEFESISINRGEGIALSGIAKPHEGRTGADGILAMTALLKETGIFDQPQPDWKPADAKGVNSFRMTVQVRDPFRNYQWSEEEDFGVRSLAVRKYGVETSTDGAPPSLSQAAPPPRGGGERTAASEPTPGEAPRGASLARGSGPRTSGQARPSATASTDGEATIVPGIPGDTMEDHTTFPDEEAPRLGGGDGRALTRRGGSGDGAPSGAATRGGLPGAPSTAIPDPLSDTQIGAMTRAEAQDALTRVAQARQSNFDKSTEEGQALDARLKDEFDKLLRRVREAK